MKAQSIRSFASYQTKLSASTALRKITCLLFIILWLYVAIDKLIHFAEFKRALQMQELPREWLKPAYYVIPLSELLAATLLLFQYTQKAGLALSSLLMLTFTAYMSYIVFGNFKYRPCSCAGIFSTMSWEQHLIVNITFLLLSIAALSTFVKPNRKEDAVTT